MIAKILKIIFCKHEWGINGWSSVKCKLCGRVKYNPRLANKLIWDYNNKMIAAGHWDRKEVEAGMKMRGK